jgi:hypothetical protein
MYVIKTPYGAFVSLHSNGKEFNLMIGSVENAVQYTKPDAFKIYCDFRKYWIENKLELHEVILSTKLSHF